MSTQPENPPMPVVDARLKLGATLFVLSIVCPLVGVPIVAAADLSGGLTATLSGGVLAAGEVLGVVAVAIMGKNGYLYIKHGVAGFLKQLLPAQKVSRTRYRIGLVMFWTPVGLGWAAPYAAPYLADHLPESVPQLVSALVPYAVAGDLLLLASLFVLGGDYWDKLRSLFVHDSEVRFAAS